MWSVRRSSERVQASSPWYFLPPPPVLRKGRKHESATSNSRRGVRHEQQPATQPNQGKRPTPQAGGRAGHHTQQPLLHCQRKRKAHRWLRSRMPLTWSMTPTTSPSRMSWISRFSTCSAVMRSFCAHGRGQRTRVSTRQIGWIKHGGWEEAAQRPTSGKGTNRLAEGGVSSRTENAPFRCSRGGRAGTTARAAQWPCPGTRESCCPGACLRAHKRRNETDVRMQDRSRSRGPGQRTVT